MCLSNKKAKLEYAAAKIAVWWDMKDCPIPDGYDARWVRPSIEWESKKLGYFGPVSITAYADQTRTPRHLLQGLSSTGVAVAHTVEVSTWSLIYKDMLEWRANNPLPATMMLISNHVQDVFFLDLLRLQQVTPYNIFMAYSSPVPWSHLNPSAGWGWSKLLSSAKNDDKKHEQMMISSGKYVPAKFYCKSSCKFDCQSLVKFRKHLSSKDHALQELYRPTSTELDPVTRKWGRNSVAKPEHATARIAVWWDMTDCPIPEDYDSRRVRSSIEEEFEKLGYSGPVSITAYADHRETPDDVLKGLYSTGVTVTHTVLRHKTIRNDYFHGRHKDNPNLMIISDHVDEFDSFFSRLQLRDNHNVFLAYSFRPYKMLSLVTSAEWLWESLLGVSKSKSRRRQDVLQKCSTKSGDSTGMFHCRSCRRDCNSFDNFKMHLSSKEHERQEYRNLISYIRPAYIRLLPKLEEINKNCRKRKASRTGFGLLHNHLRARKSQPCKKRVVELLLADAASD